jgi:hypothetical protein
MTSRDRVLLALAHEEPERVPLDFTENILALYDTGYGYHGANHRSQR